MSGGVTLGMETLDGYRAQTAWFGALIGRYGNRIGGAQFALEGKTYQLPKNDGPNTLHGGSHGFGKQVWQAREVTSTEGPAVEFSYVSKDGEEGFPGTLTDHGGLHADEQERAEDRLHGDHG
jgi:aldose 1-epimerase